MPRPLIGVTACVRPEDREWHAVSEPYLRAVTEGCGGIPVIIPALADAVATDELLDRLDGLLVTGSPSNVEPARYGGAAPRPTTLLDKRRDATTLVLIERALGRRLPLFAICRGMQELNVALGGTLHQHLEEVPGRFDHRAPKDRPMAERYAPVHDVTLTPGGALAALAGGASSARVNSLHGQGIDRLAPGLVVEASAADGSVEAVRVDAVHGRSPRAFALGVQWHPEWLFASDALSRALFAEFAAAADRASPRRAAE